MLRKVRSTENLLAGVRELVINAYAHRNYFDHNAPVFFAVYDDRVEIVSPGGLPRGLSVEEVLSGHSKIRNRVLAAALNYMHYIEEWGSGMLRVQNDLREYSHPGLEIEDTGVDFTFRVRRLPEKVHIESKREHVREHVCAQVKKLVFALKGEMTERELRLAVGVKNRPNFTVRYLGRALQDGFIERAASSTRSPTQKYRLTEKGRHLQKDTNSNTPTS